MARQLQTWEQCEVLVSYHFSYIGNSAHRPESPDLAWCMRVGRALSNPYLVECRELQCNAAAGTVFQAQRWKEIIRSTTISQYFGEPVRIMEY